MGFEPTPLRDLAGCSAAELLGLCGEPRQGTENLVFEDDVIEIKKSKVYILQSCFLYGMWIPVL